MSQGLTWHDLEVATGHEASSLMGLSTGAMSPVYELTTKTHYAGQVKPVALAISEVLGVSLEDMFPRYVCRIRKDTDDMTDGQLIELSESQYSREAADPRMNGIVEADAIEDMRKRLNFNELFREFLKPREELALRRRFGLDTGTPRTLDAIGREIGVSRNRVRQIEAKALRKLRNPRVKEAMRGDE